MAEMQETLSQFVAQITEVKATKDGGFLMKAEGGIGKLEEASQAALLLPIAVSGIPVQITITRIANHESLTAISRTKSKRRK